MKCKLCGIETNNIKYCSRMCASSARTKNKPNCLFCEQELPKSYRKFCSNLCQSKYKQEIIIRKWKEGKISGLQTIGVVTYTVKNYLRQKYKDKCSLCGWAQLNPYTNKVPLVADHIDGNWKNNTEENLRLLCPNCDSLQATYGGGNRGKGRTLNGNLRKK